MSPTGPFTFGVAQDNKNSQYNACYIYPHEFFLTDINVYYDDGSEVAYKKKYREEYKKFIKRVFNILLGKNNYNPQDVLDVEIDIFNTLGCVDVKPEEEWYNKVYADEALTKYGFDWKEFSKQLGFKTTPKFIITTSLNYLMTR